MNLILNQVGFRIFIDAWDMKWRPQKKLNRFSYWLLETLNTEYIQYIEVFGQCLEGLWMVF